jgi:hypothetical protein
MSKPYLFLAFVCLGILLVASLVAPGSSIMWLASTSKVFAVIRAGLMIILLWLLITDPPRNVYLRVVTGTASILLVSWALNAFFSNQLQLVDFLSLVPAGIAAGLDVLESSQLADEAAPTEKSAA